MRATTLLGLTTATLMFASCIPTAARRNARVEPGFDAELLGGGQALFEGTDEEGNATDVKETAHGELNLQYGALLDDSSAVAVQLKIPLTVVYTTVDFYWQLPSPDQKTFYGAGVELSLYPGLYLVFTRYLGEFAYVSLTPRVLTQFDSVAARF